MDTIKKIPVNKLHFDLRNPRLVEFSQINSKTSEEEIIKILWEAMDVRELVLSIASSGYFEHEPLIITQEKEQNIVIEGNRRLAAIKVILNPELIGNNIPDVAEEIKKEILEIPSIMTTRADAWRYLGFKHVNGPAKWGSYAKARYIAQVHIDFKVSLDHIATQIGDTHKTVQRLYRGLMVIEQAEKEKIFSREDSKKDSFPFSHMYTGLQLRGISRYLDLNEKDEDTKDFVPKNKIKKLEEVCRWLYGSKKNNIEPVVQSQNPNLRQLDEILQNNEALNALKNGESIETALELTKPVSNIFEEELYKAKRSLVKAKGLVTEGYDGSDALLKLVESISNIAYDLYKEMERKNNPGIKRVSKTE
jgi:hypothetical protein